MQNESIDFVGHYKSGITEARLSKRQSRLKCVRQQDLDVFIKDRKIENLRDRVHGGGGEREMYIDLTSRRSAHFTNRIHKGKEWTFIIS